MVVEDYQYYFHNPSPFKINDEVAWNYCGKYKKATVVSEQYIAPSGVPHTDIKIKNTIYAVPTYDLRDINSVKIINEAFIFCANRNGDMIIVENLLTIFNLMEKKLIKLFIHVLEKKLIYYYLIGIF